MQQVLIDPNAFLTIKILTQLFWAVPQALLAIAYSMKKKTWHATQEKQCDSMNNGQHSTIISVFENCHTCNNHNIGGITNSTVELQT